MDGHLLCRKDCCTQILVADLNEQIERARYSDDALARKVGVNHGRFQALVPQKQLHRAKVDAIPLVDKPRRHASNEWILCRR